MLELRPRFKATFGSHTYRMRAFGLVAMIPALGAGGPGFKSRIAPRFLLFLIIDYGY